nr:immunoglobulin light chain junction region [Mus musculus]NSL97723.1 immunoglobulin light chain junction region [Mus musculus]NSL97995.1 immunoglobulin light chain junction region [Mus musculus]NSL98049.1 immunoglobulin light chain junction region [Mus musculus]NSL98053.1 immunoglobulin light chain junction region [Mus musculus]
CWQGTHFPLTF